jgi:hypothetical protein
MANGGESTNKSWQSFNFSDWKAKKVMESVMAKIDSYQIEDDNYALKVIDPNGVDFYCQGYTGID